MAKIITPVVTILDKNEKPDYDGNKKVIDFLIAYTLSSYIECSNNKKLNF